STELYANLLQAKANLSSESAKLAEMKAGTRSEEILVYEAKALNAEFALSDARKNLEDKLVDAFTKSDDAVRAKADQFINGAIAQVGDGQLKASVEQGRAAIEVVLDEWAGISAVIESETDPAPIISIVQRNLLQIQAFLNKAGLAVNGLTASVSLSQTTIDGYRSDVSTARTNVNTAITNLSTAVEKWNNAETSFAIAARELDLKRAGSTPEAIQSQEANVEEQEAAIASIEAQLARNSLTSPIRGTVTLLDVKPGEIVNAGTKVVSVISEDALEIEAHVSEVSVGKVAVANPVRITLDAFPGESFPGKIIYLEPAETIIDGVVNFKVKASFDSPDPRLKSGLTANVYIETAKKESVIAIPRYAVETRESKFFVNIRGIDGRQAEREIVLGLQSVDGFVEVISGLSEGEKILVALKK
ncbi:MAG: efflux RND transporter periplasmic adaptor subunit, partial [Patescibacteria group bacterium]